MTQKELLYLEDAVGHEKAILKILEDNVNNVQDENLVSFLQEELNNHNEICENLMNFLEGKANE